MPKGFASESQRRYLWMHDPKVAQQIYDDASPKNRARKLPYHARTKSRKKTRP